MAIFKQLFDEATSTFTYLIADERTRSALLIDPVHEQYERDRALLDELGLNLKYVLETHVHADHITGGGRLRHETDAQFIVGKGTYRDAGTHRWLHQLSLGRSPVHGRYHFD
nr:MBL fold metallo-hydrolase [Halothiobacillus sp. 15-55-196]